MKVKFIIQPEWQSILNDGPEAFEETVNGWIADKKIIDIKYKIDRIEKGAFVSRYFSVMILYEDTEPDKE